MSDYLCISVSLLDERYHGRADGNAPEWPPSPLRLLQAIVAANGDEIGADGELNAALAWLESRDPPLIVTPRFELGAPYCLSVPNNSMDIVGRHWSQRNYFGTGDASPATHRTMKMVRPVRLVGGDTIRYVWPLSIDLGTEGVHIEPLAQAAAKVVALGWGIDLVVGCGQRITSEQFGELPGERWNPTVSSAGTQLRTPIRGTVAALQDRYHSFLGRVGKFGLIPAEPLAAFDVVGYRRPSDPLSRPYAVFELRHDDDSYCRYSQRKLIHIAGMVRHLSKALMSQAPPPDVDEDWVQRFVVGHRDKSQSVHEQVSYLPLPSIGHTYADQAIRRVMITAPPGADGHLGHLARWLEGSQLEPQCGDEFGDQGPPTLVRIRSDGVTRCYVRPGNRWASVTPVILPGHDDRKPGKTRRLIESALAQSGFEQNCTFQWSCFSHFVNSLSAHKYDRDKKPTGYIRPDHLLTQTAVHLTLQFPPDVKVPGPLAIGAGRHCGFGLMACVDE